MSVSSTHSIFCILYIYYHSSQKIYLLWGRLSPLCSMFSSYIHFVVKGIKGNIFFFAEYHFIAYIFHILFTEPSIDGHSKEGCVVHIVDYHQISEDSIYCLNNSCTSLHFYELCQDTCSPSYLYLYFLLLIEGESHYSQDSQGISL